MKKVLILMIAILLIAIGVVGLNYKDYEIKKIDNNLFNSTYEEYNKTNLNGLDITTIMNKAISNNEKYKIPKDEKNLYILDDEYSIIIYVKMVKDEPAYRMERFSEVGINDFIRYFGEINFKCTELTYHEKNGRIASMTFEIEEY